MRNIYSTRGSLINFILIFIALLLLYEYRYGLGMLNPLNDGWLMKHDWATHYLGWFFFRNEPWGLPIGNISNYLFPVGTNVGFTDSIPLAAIFFKLFSPLLPETFQYIGGWLFMCHVLTAFFLLKLFELFSVRGLLQLAATLIVVFNPVLLHRSIHPALCSHWLIIGSLWVYFLDPQKHSPTRLLTYQGIFLLVGGLINPYFSLIEAGFFVALAWRLWQFDHKVSFLKAVMGTSVAFAVLFLGWYTVGFFGFKNQGDLGIGGAYGLYAFNLNSLYNSGGWSTDNPARPLVSWHQYEGYMYLGLGMIGLLLLVLFLLLVKFIRRKIRPAATEVQERIVNVALLPLVCFVIFISLFAITNVITWNDKVLFTIPLHSKLQKLADIFRASGRYFWVFYYLVFIVVIVFAIRLIRHVASVTVLLIVVFLIQLNDYKNLIGRFVYSYEPYHPPISEVKWRGIFEKLDRFIFYPPFKSTNLTDADYRYFCYLAADYHKPIDLGYAARSDYNSVANYEEELKQNIDLGRLDAKALYISTAEFVGHFTVSYQLGLISCGQLDDYYFFYPKGMENDPAFAGLGKEIPEILTERRIFKPFSLTQKDNEVELPMKVEHMERSPKTIYLKGWILKGNVGNADSVSILLKSENGEIFKTAISTRKNVAKVTDSARFNGTYFTDELTPGNYKIGVYFKSSQDKSKTGSYRFFGSINVGYPDLFQPKELTDVPKLQWWLDEYEDLNDKIKVRGWAFIQGQSSYYDRIEILLKTDDKIYVCPTDPNLRPDVTSYFNSPVNLETAGFISAITKKGLPKGQYEVGIRVTNDRRHIREKEYTGRVFVIKK